MGLYDCKSPNPRICRNIGNDFELQVLALNCRGSTGEEKLVEMEYILNELKWDIICLSEVRRYGENLIRRKNGNWFYYIGETRGYRGVGFYIHKRTDKIIEVKGVNERLAVLKLELQKEMLCYL